MSLKASAIWDEVQGSCDATRLQRALDAVSDKLALLDGWTPLQYVCENRSIDDETRANAIHILSKAGFDVNAVDENGWTALHLLCKNKHADDVSQSISAMLSSRATTTIATKDSSKLPLHLLCENEAVTPGALGLLVKATTTINAVDSDGNTPLHYLSENSSISPQLLETVLAAKANADIQNKFLSTPFHSLCQHSNVSVQLVELMLKHKANPNVPNNIGNTAFHYVCENYALTVDILQVFISSKQVNLTATNSLGKTALELIPSHKHDCLAIAQTVGAPSLGGSNSLTASREAAKAGGEDASELPPSLARQLEAWNSSLPPFDMAFYNAVCCEVAFATLYEHVQDVSAQVCEAPNDATLLKSWEQALASWRVQLVLAFVALVPPDLWESYASKFNRRVPSDIERVRGQVVDVWARFSTPTQRRQRLEALTAILPAAK